MTYEVLLFLIQHFLTIFLHKSITCMLNVSFLSVFIPSNHLYYLLFTVLLSTTDAIWSFRCMINYYLLSFGYYWTLQKIFFASFCSLLMILDFYHWSIVRFCLCGFLSQYQLLLWVRSSVHDLFTCFICFTFQ